MNARLHSEGKVLMRLVRGLPRTGTHRQQLEAFYGPQAVHYDAFRDRLLHGRRRLIECLQIVPGQTLVELGAGTGRNLEFLRDRVQELKRVDIVDLCPPLLEVAKRRCKRWTNVRVIEGDATRYDPGEAVDRVYLAYSLTMIPDWTRAVNNALRILKPGGLLGVVDFYVSHSRPEPGGVRHGMLSRLFWRNWFAHDGVHLSPDHLAYLDASCSRLHRIEALGRVPYLPGVRVPYYIFVGRNGPAIESASQQ